MPKITRINKATIPVRDLKWLQQWLLNQAAENMFTENVEAMRAYDRASLALELLIELNTKETK